MCDQPNQSKSSASSPFPNGVYHKGFTKSRSVDLDCTDVSTDSLLSPIYNNTSESDPEDVQGKDMSEMHKKSINLNSNDGQMVSHAEATVKYPCSGMVLSAWEKWIICKARQDRLRMERKAMEAIALKEAKEQQEKEEERKKIASEQRIQEWLHRKREQEKTERELNKKKELEEKISKEETKMESERRAQKRYKEWLQKKNQEEMAKKQKEQEEAAKIEAEAIERKQKAEDKFRKWLISVKSRPLPVLAKHTHGHYSNVYPTPSYYNPIPWKPILNPPPESVPKKNGSNRRRKSSACILHTQTPSVPYRPKDNLAVILRNQYSKTSRY